MLVWWNVAGYWLLVTGLEVLKFVFLFVVLCLDVFEIGDMDCQIYLTGSISNITSKVYEWIAVCFS